jgi:hypothetical protein
VPPARDRIEDLYRRILAQGLDLTAEGLSGLLTDLYEACLVANAGYERTELTTQIAGKSYFAFEKPDGKISRAVNESLYEPSPEAWSTLVEALRGQDFAPLTLGEMTKAVYSLAMSFCVHIDLTRTRDQKTPGTLFEYLIGHLFASRLGVNPRNRLPVLNLDMETTLPTDYVFDLGRGQPKFHLPIKTSTRERMIQVWAHQRVLDGVYGTGRFLGTPVILAETMTRTATREVVEICLPDQWRLYQMHIAQLKRIYYLDVPAAYEPLGLIFPPIHVRPFGQFFFEAEELSA